MFVFPVTNDPHICQTRAKAFHERICNLLPVMAWIVNLCSNHRIAGIVDGSCLAKDCRHGFKLWQNSLHLIEPDNVVKIIIVNINISKLDQAFVDKLIKNNSLLPDTNLPVLSQWILQLSISISVLHMRYLHPLDIYKYKKQALMFIPVTHDLCPVQFPVTKQPLLFA